MARRPVNLPYTITTGFGVPDSNSKFGYHTGVDYAKPVGSAVYAPEQGVVTDTSSYQYNGLVVQIKGYDGLYHRKMHNSKVLVSVGQSVKEGQQVALSGNSGLSTGPHVHWDICSAKIPTAFSQFRDPDKWLATPPPVIYPKWVMVKVPVLYVRSAPRTSAPLAGSRFLLFGTPVRAAALVTGESVAGNNKWYKSMYGNYFWSGGVK